MNTQQTAPSILTTLRYALKTYAHHFILLITASSIYSVSDLTYSYLQKQLILLRNIPLFIISWLVSTLVFLFLLLGIIQITLDLYRKKESSLFRLISCIRLFPTFFVASLIFASLFIMTTWLIGALVYAIFFYYKGTFQYGKDIFLPFSVAASLILSPLIFFPYFIVDLKIPALQSLQLSFRKTKKYLSTILVLIVFFEGIDYVLYKVIPLNTIYDYFPLIVGILIRPIIFLSFVYLYGHMERPKSEKH